MIPRPHDNYAPFCNETPRTGRRQAAANHRAFRDMNTRVHYDAIQAGVAPHCGAG